MCWHRWGQKVYMLHQREKQIRFTKTDSSHTLLCLLHTSSFSLSSPPPPHPSHFYLEGTQRLNEGSSTSSLSKTGGCMRRIKSRDMRVSPGSDGIHLVTLRVCVHVCVRARWVSLTELLTILFEEYLTPLLADCKYVGEGSPVTHERGCFCWWILAHGCVMHDYCSLVRNVLINFIFREKSLKIKLLPNVSCASRL